MIGAILLSVGIVVVGFFVSLIVVDRLAEGNWFWQWMRNPISKEERKKNVTNTPKPTEILVDMINLRIIELDWKDHVNFLRTRNARNTRDHNWIDPKRNIHIMFNENGQSGISVETIFINEKIVSLSFEERDKIRAALIQSRKINTEKNKIKVEADRQRAALENIENLMSPSIPTGGGGGLDPEAQFRQRLKPMGNVDLYQKWMSEC